MRTTTFTPPKASSRLWKLLAAMLFVWLLIPVGQVSAQTSGKTGYWKWDGTTLTLTCNPNGDTEFRQIEIWQYPGWTTSGVDIRSKVKTVKIDESFKDARPTTCNSWFASMSALTNIEGIEYLNTEDVTDMSSMFYECGMLTQIDLSHFRTEKVTNMSNMFHYCYSLKSLDMSAFKTPLLTNTSHMFAACVFLTTLDLRNFDISKISDTDAMFSYCQSLKSIYANDWSSDLSSANSKEMFDGCDALVGAVAFDASKLDATMANGQTGYFMPRYTDGNGKVTYFEKDANNQIVLNLYNANPFVVTTAYNIDKGTYTRQSMPSNWGTVCVPFIIDVTNAETNCEIYKFHAVEGENLYIEKVAEGEIAAGTPVIVKGTQGTDLKVCSPERNQAIVTAPVNGTETNHLEGTFAGEKLEGTSNYFIAKDKFWQVSTYDNEGNTIKGVNVPPFRATITAKGTQAQSLGIVVIDETNGIDLTPTVDDLLSDKAEYFDLQGRRLDGPQKGINLVRMGGKTRKVVIK